MSSLVARIKGDLRTGSPLLAYQALVHGGAAEGLQVAATLACGYANLDVKARYDARNPQALKRLVANGALLHPFSQAVMEACLKASNEVNAETSASNPDFKKIYESQMAFRDDENLWWQVAKYSYETFMIRTRPKG